MGNKMSGKEVAETMKGLLKGRVEVLEKEGITLDERFQDGGMQIYQKNQDAHAGGSGAGCSAAGWASSAA